MRKLLAFALVLVFAFAGCALAAEKPLVVGFAQIGAESGWRTAETESVVGTAKELGIDLKFSDAQQKQ